MATDQENPFHAIVGAPGNMHNTAQIVGKPFLVKPYRAVSCQVSFVGTAVGTFTFKTINYDQPFLGDGVTTNPAAPPWSTLTPANAAAFAAGNPAGGTGDFNFKFPSVEEVWMALYYDNLSGTGQLDAWFSGKK